MKVSLLGTLLLSGCLHTQHKFLSPIHADIDAVCRFSKETQAVRNDLEKLGPTLRPQIKTEEVVKALKNLDKEGGETLYLLSIALGYDKCDLIEVLKVEE